MKQTSNHLIFQKLRDSLKGKIQEKIGSFRSKSSESSESEYSEPTEVIETYEAADNPGQNITDDDKSVVIEPAVAKEEKSDEVVANPEPNNIPPKIAAKKKDFWPRGKEKK